MVYYHEVIVPGPWWNTLTYRFDRALPQAVRVIVPVGRGKRTGFVSRVSSECLWPENRVRSISSVIDEESVIPMHFWNLTDWTGMAFMCGRGEVLKSLLPDDLLKGKEIPPMKKKSDISCINSNKIETFYRWIDSERIEKYYECIKDCSGQVIVSFPEQETARRFFKELPAEIASQALLWPATGGKKLLKSWVDVRDGLVDVIVGGPGVVAAPASDLSLIIVDQEGSDSFRSQRYPRLNTRSVLARFAKETNSDLLLGGRIPSSRIFRGCSPSEVQSRPGKRLSFVNIFDGNKISIPGITWDIPLGESSMVKTLKCTNDGRVALWLLDRKGYAGDIHCDDCGESIYCHCGGTFKLEKDRMVCLKCGDKRAVPDKCPHCGGPVLVCKSPGIDALLTVAKNVLPEDRVFIWQLNNPKGVKERKERLASISHGGLVIGTRKALELCDLSDVGLVCWIDGDGEARRTELGARYTAYSLISESCWRGNMPESREVVVQSRRPGKGWQVALQSGWTQFWEKELEERREFDLPPFRYLVQISNLGVEKDKLVDSLLDSDIDAMDPDPDADLIWVSVKSLTRLRKILSKYYNIGSSRDYPRVVVSTD